MKKSSATLRQEMSALSAASDRLERGGGGGGGAGEEQGGGDEERLPNANLSNSSNRWSDPEPELDEWECKANDAINFKLVMFEEDIADPKTTFHPTYTHQVFDNQIIRGYKEPRIDMYYTAGSLQLYLGLSYGERRVPPASAYPPPKPNTEVYQTLNKFIPPDYTTNIDEFVKRLSTPFKPPGHVIRTYKLDKHDSGKNEKAKDKGTEDQVSYMVTKGDFSSEEVKAFHRRIQVFVLWYIDRSSYLDDEDLEWEIYFIFEKRIREGKEHYRVVGYCTVYPFFAYPDSIRLRISQVLVLPPYQKQGHGAHLLNAIYDDAKARKGSYEHVKDITVEDPSPEFTFLRDVTDLRNCWKHGFLTKQNYTEELDASTIAAIQKELRLFKKQIEHLHEVVSYMYIDKSNKAKYKRYRLRVKQRLYKKYQDWLQGYEEGEPRRQELHDIYLEEVENFYRKIEEKLLLGD
ncbi:histone acetyltransferase 1 [Balamuthia mandrillaris]